MVTPNNIAILIGRLGKEPEIRQINGNNVAKFTLAVDRTKNKDGTKITDWFNCEVWGRQAEVLTEYATKGTQISVVGSIKIDSREVQGEKKNYTTISVGSFQLLGKSKESSNDSESYAPSQTKSAATSSLKTASFIEDLDDDLPPF
jgi:single-strand DNA-binding protein